MELGPQEIIIIVLIVVILFGVAWAAKNKHLPKRPGSSTSSTDKNNGSQA